MPQVFHYQGFGSNWASLAQSFTTGSSASTLNGITLSLASGGTGSGFTVYLMSDNAGTPGNILETLSGPTSPGTGDITFTSGSSLPLDANTTYWWEATIVSTPNATFYLSSTTSTSETGSSGWSIGDVGSHNYYVAPWTPSAQAYIFSVSGTTAVPEPGTSAALAGLASLALLAYRRWRQD